MESFTIFTFDFLRISIASWMFLGVLLLILTTLSSFCSPALMAGPPDTTCDTNKLLWLVDGGNTGLLLADLGHKQSGVWGGDLVTCSGDYGEAKPLGTPAGTSEWWIMMNWFVYFVNSPNFDVQSLHSKIVSFLLADFQDSVLRIYRQKLHESFLLLPFSPFSPWARPYAWYSW